MSAGNVGDEVAAIRARIALLAKPSSGWYFRGVTGVLRRTKDDYPDISADEENSWSVTCRFQQARKATDGNEYWDDYWWDFDWGLVPDCESALTLARLIDPSFEGRRLAPYQMD